MIKVYISGNRADVTEREPLTSGTVGKVINFAFTADWRPLIKYAVFEGSGRRIALTNIGDSCIIPHEVLAKHGGALRVGVYGRTADGSAATPTVYAQLGIIQRGADPNADPSTKPTLPVWAQIQAQIGDMAALETEAKDSLVAAINEAAKSGGDGSGGKDGTGIESITYKGEDESGGNMYTVLLTDGTSYDITAPKGAKGDKGDKGDTGPAGPQGEKGDAAPIDKTLTQEGQAADSKAVGDAINSLSEEIANLQTSGLTTAQVNALDGMFKVVAYDADSGYAAAYVAFQTAFGLTGSGESGGEETGVSNESTWTSGVAYTFEAVQNEYVSEKDGSFITYSGWNRTPYLYCKGAAVLRAVVNTATSMMASNNSYNAFYDESKNFIESFSVAGIDCNTVGSYTDIEVPANAAYFTASHKAGVIGTGTGSVSHALGFVPYSEVPV